MQYRPKKLNKLILHKDIGENLSKLVSHCVWHTASNHTDGHGVTCQQGEIQLQMLLKLLCRLLLATALTPCSMVHLEQARRH